MRWYGIHPYKQHFACFDCRKAFKRQDGDWGARPGPKPGRWTFHWVFSAQAPCPACGRPMVAMGFDFKAPRGSDRKQWRKVQLVALHGIRFSSFGCGGPGPRPRNLAEVGPFLDSMPPSSDGEVLLRAMAQRQTRPKARRPSH